MNMFLSDTTIVKRIMVVDRNTQRYTFSIMIEFKLNRLIRKKQLDESHGVSNRELARQIGISHVVLFKMRNNRPYNAGLRVIDKLCKFFKCKVGDVLEYRK